MGVLASSGVALVIHVPPVNGVIHGLMPGRFAVSAGMMLGLNHRVPGVLFGRFLFLVLGLTRIGMLVVDRRAAFFLRPAFLPGRVVGVVPVIFVKILTVIFHDCPPFVRATWGMVGLIHLAQAANRDVNLLVYNEPIQTFVPLRSS
jgi:hypothetical protein